jgi:hypothetical protein
VSPHLVRRTLFAALAAVAVVPGPPASAGGPCGVKGAPRIVAVGDVHGSYDRFVGILQTAGVLDASGKWAGGRAHLVQVGDVLDRGLEGPKVLDFLMRLESQAEKAGGRVYPLLGNHEVMNVLGDLRYVSADEYKSFRTPQSERRREHLYEISMARARDNAKARGEAFDETAFRAKFNEQAPLGYSERLEAFSESGRYGRWLRRHDTLATIDGVAFLHGGLTPEVAALGCEAINERVRREIGPDFDKTLAGAPTTLAAGENGPLWYRGLARGTDAEVAPLADAVLKALGVRAVVIGHTVTGTGAIVARVGGKIVMIDAGMTDQYGGHAAALEIDAEGRMTAIYPDRREPLQLPAAAALEAAPGSVGAPGPGDGSFSLAAAGGADLQ